jgi:hypothetical protein
MDFDSTVENNSIPHWELIPKYLMDIKIGCPENYVSEYFVVAMDVIFFLSLLELVQLLV